MQSSRPSGFLGNSTDLDSAGVQKRQKTGNVAKASGARPAGLLVSDQFLPFDMAKRRKTRTHAAKADQAKKVNDGTPKSFVIHAGQVGSSVKALSKDVRRVLEPNTATRLRERKSNKIKDFIAMAAPLGVTHMVVLGQSTANTSAVDDDQDEASSNVNLRITRMPRGPTLGFKVLRYALARDILAATKRPRSPGKEFATEPILILNNFSSSANESDARQLSLMQTMFQNLFPPIKVHTMALSNARRVVLLSYNPVTKTIDFRHYLISVRPVGVSRSIRKLIEGTGSNGRKRLRETSVYSAAPSEVSTAASASFTAPRAKGLPNLNSAQDISDYVLNHGDMGYLSSASEAESEASGGEEGPETKQVELSAPYVGRANRRTEGEKRAVRLSELGPRMELGLVKIEDGIGDGKGEVLFHEFIHKTAKEAAEIQRRAKEKERLAKQRRAEQEANVKRKQEEKEAKKKARQDARGKGQASEGGEESDEDEDDDGEESPNEFEYEDMFAEGGKGGQDGAVEDDSEEQFEEAEEHEGDEDEDDSDLSPIPIEEGEESSEDEDARPSQRQKSFGGRPRGKSRTGAPSKSKFPKRR